MQEGWAAIQTTGVRLNRAISWRACAEALLHAGQPDTGLTMLAEALAFIHTSGERWWEAECHRLWGECLLAQQGPKPEPGEAVARFQHALEMARQQQARSLELRAAMSLSRLWQQQGKRAEARQLLRRCTAGSPRVLTPPTCRKPGRCWTIWHETAGGLGAFSSMRIPHLWSASTATSASGSRRPGAGSGDYDQAIGAAGSLPLGVQASCLL